MSDELEDPVEVVPDKKFNAVYRNNALRLKEIKAEGAP